jgi:hypothetical protein
MVMAHEFMWDRLAENKIRGSASSFEEKMGLNFTGKRTMFESPVRKRCQDPFREKGS